METMKFLKLTSAILRPRYFYRSAIKKELLLCTCRFSVQMIRFSSNELKLVTPDCTLEEMKTTGFDKSKARIVLQLNFKTPEDALPFYKLPITTLLHIYKTTKNDEKLGFCNNRLYYIASQIQCPSSAVSVKLSKRTFVYSLSFHWLQNSLQTLLDMGVPGERILKDLWALKYSHETIHERLKTIKDRGVNNLYPWMVRCNADILERYLQIIHETRDILGDTKSLQVYLAKRLNTTPEYIEDMCCKIPALKTIRVTKVKSFVDFLLQEGFAVEDIASKPRVLTSSQKTVQQRIEQLRKLGVSSINLNVVCRSRKDFKKYCESIESVKKENNI